MEIRFLTSDDARAWWRLRLEALEGDPEAFSSSTEEHHTLKVEDVKNRIGSLVTDSFVVGAFDGRQLAGTAGFVREKGPKSRHKGRVWGVYLTPPARGKGIGRRMMEVLLEQASKIDGVEQILISVSETQVTAASLYRSLGFEQFGCEPRALKVGDRYIAELYMVRLNSYAGGANSAAPQK